MDQDRSGGTPAPPVNEGICRLHLDDRSFSVSTLPAARSSAGVSLPRLAVGLNAGLAAAAVLLWLGMAVRGEFWRADFSAFYTGWSMALDGHGDQLYDLNRQAEYESRIVPGRAAPDQFLPYVYPPQFILAAPLALLPLPEAFYAWTALQAALLAVVVRWLCEDVRPHGPTAPALAATTLLAFQPVFLTFQLGQQALISLVALYGLARALRDGRDVHAGAWLALTSLKPQLALLPALFLLGGGRWRVLLIAGGLFAAAAAAATAVLGWHCWLDFASLTRFHSEQFDSLGIFPLRGHHLKMLFAALLGRENLPLINTLTGAGLLVSLGAALVLGRLARNADRARWELCFALTSLLVVLAAPHINPHDALLLVVPAVLFLDALSRTGGPVQVLAGVLVACPLLFLADSYAMDWWPSRVRPFFFVIVALAVWVARELTRGTPVTTHFSSVEPVARTGAVTENSPAGR
jgi:hypothetical protein